MPSCGSRNRARLAAGAFAAIFLLVPVGCTRSVPTPRDADTPMELAASQPDGGAVSVSGGGRSSRGINVRVPEPAIIWRPIPFGRNRKEEMAAYARRHYGLDSWRLQGPRLIVEHYTDGPTFQSAWNYFAANGSHLGELPGVCAHFVIDTDGTIYQLVPLHVMCRHVIGLNWTAIGIEHVGTSDEQILHDRRQLRSSLRLTVWLMWKFHIPVRDVIGHAESLTSPLYRELVPSYRCQTHSDWLPADMRIYRRDVAELAREYGLTTGPLAPHSVSNDC